MRADVFTFWSKKRKRVSSTTTLPVNSTDRPHTMFSFVSHNKFTTFSIGKAECSSILRRQLLVILENVQPAFNMRIFALCWEPSNFELPPNLEQRNCYFNAKRLWMSSSVPGPTYFSVIDCLQSLWLVVLMVWIYKRSYSEKSEKFRPFFVDASQHEDRPLIVVEWRFSIFDSETFECGKNNFLRPISLPFEVR